MSSRRFLGVDLGARRIGIAVSDPTGLLASPLLQFAHPGSLAALADRLTELARAEDATGIVVGDPRHAGGEASRGSAAALALAGALRARGAIQVWLWNEWGSTAEAAARLSAARVARSRGQGPPASRHAAARRLRRERLDRAAAAVLLQDFLDAHRDRALPAAVALPSSDAGGAGPCA
jgi:putative Holliday junction resolvase